MGVAYVQSNQASGNSGPGIGGINISYRGDIATGNLLVLLIGLLYDNGTPSWSVSDSFGNSYTQVPDYYIDVAGDWYVTMFYAVANASGSNTVNVIGSPGPQDGHFYVAEYAGVDASFPLYSYNGQSTDGSSTMSAGDVPIVTTGSLLISLAIAGTGVGTYEFTAQSGSTTRENQDDGIGQSAFQDGLYDSTLPATFTGSVAPGGSVMMGASFTPASAPPTFIAAWAARRNQAFSGSPH
jgi:hypothetical protein